MVDKVQATFRMKVLSMVETMSRVETTYTVETPNIPVLLVFPVGGDRNAAMASVLIGIRVVTETVRMGHLHVLGERCVVMGSVLTGIMGVVG